MRTTLTIDDDLLAEAKVIAAQSHRTIGSVVNDALREMILRRDFGATAHEVELPTSPGWLVPGVDLDDKEQIAELMGDNEIRW